jgi:sec-independent protein translocase protein TatA
MVGDIMQPTHLLFVLIVALLVLGPKRLPEVGRQLGSGIRDFRAAMNGERPEQSEQVMAPPVEPAPQPQPAPVASTVPSAPPSTVPSAPEFAPQAPATAVAERRTAGETGVVEHRTSESDDRHEFAYEAPRPASQRTDPGS